MDVLHIDLLRIILAEVDRSRRTIIKSAEQDVEPRLNRMTIGRAHHNATRRFTDTATLADEVIMIFDVFKDLNRNDQIKCIVLKWPAPIKIGLRERDISQTKFFFVDVGGVYRETILTRPF